MPPWLHKVKVTSKFQQICILLTMEIEVLKHIFIQIHNNWGNEKSIKSFFSAVFKSYEMTTKQILCSYHEGIPSY